MDLVVSVDSRHHGKGPIRYAWHPNKKYIASTGSTRVVHIFDTHGKVVDQVIPPFPSPCISLEWDCTGDTLAILQGSPAHGIVLWNVHTRQTEHIDLGLRDPAFAKWSKTGSQLAIGTGKGSVHIYDMAKKQCARADAKHKKRISLGDWNMDNKFVFASDYKQITITTADGKTFGQVKVKAKPTSVQFGVSENGGSQNIVSVGMEHKTILLYDLMDPENALELAFQQRYGHIVGFVWFKDGRVLVGFHLGFLVVISTHPSEIGREQRSSKFHDGVLTDLAYCPARHQIVTVGDHFIKIIDVRTWSVLRVLELDRSIGPLEHLEWTSDGKNISISTTSGALFVFCVRSESNGLDNSTSPTLLAALMSPMSPKSFVLSAAAVVVMLLMAVAWVLELSMLQLLTYLFHTHTLFYAQSLGLASGSGTSSAFAMAPGDQVDDLAAGAGIGDGGGGA